MHSVELLLSFTKSLKSEATQSALSPLHHPVSKAHQSRQTGGFAHRVGQPQAMQQVGINYLVSERERGTSHSSRNVAYHAIKHSYEINDVMLNWKKIASFLGSDDRKSISRGYTLEEIKKLLTKADERERVIILTLASTGMRLGGLSELKIRHLKKIDHQYQFTVYELSKKERYVTFCTQQCAQAIDSYFDYRVSMGERLTPDSPSSERLLTSITLQKQRILHL